MPALTFGTRRENISVEAFDARGESLTPSREVEMERLVLDPVGVVHSEHREPKETPIQPVCAQGSRGRVEVFERYAEALDDIEGFSHLHLIYWLHRAREIAGSVAGSSPLKVVPFLDDVPRGVFATRTPVRPNPLGLSIVRLLERRGAELLVEDLDVLDGTPLLDIKPCVEASTFGSARAAAGPSR
jgi:tRNA (adenine37-N6)-methyltransferase